VCLQKNGGRLTIGYYLLFSGSRDLLCAWLSLVIIFNGEKTLVRYCRTVVSEKLNYFLGVQIVERERKIERAKEREKTRGVSPRFFPLFRSLYFSLALFFARAPLSERLEQAIS